MNRDDHKHIAPPRAQGQDPQVQYPRLPVGRAVVDRASGDRASCPARAPWTGRLHTGLAEGSRPMSKYCLQLKPHTVDATKWWYEDAKGIMVYLAPTDHHAATKSFLIPAGQVRRYLKRLDAKPNPRIKKQSKTRAQARRADA